jgi:DNA-binding SARP family transcriptional activator/tetratricopeptide (TPR) repeat protein
MTTQSLELWLLGTWHASLNGRPLASLPTRYARVLLARLALAHPQAIPRARLSNDLFPDAEPEYAARHLRTTLYYVRRVLGADLISAGPTIALSPSLQVSHDVGQFDAASGPNATRADLEHAAALFRGPLLDLSVEGWAAQEAQRLHARFVDVLRRLVTLARAVDTPETAFTAARRWVEAEPWEEEAHIALIQALVGRGDHPAAEQHLVRARAALQAEWGGPASPALAVLSRRVGRAKAEAAPAIALTQAHTNVDLMDFERLPLIGREQELERLGTAWARARADTAGPLIIEGVAGVGKTRLVRELMTRARLRADTIMFWGVGSERTSVRTFGLFRNALIQLPGSIQRHLHAAYQTLDASTQAILFHGIPEIQPLFPDTAESQEAAEIHASPPLRRAALLALLKALAARGSLLLIFDNAERGDEDTLAVLAMFSAAACHALLLLIRRPTPQSSHIAAAFQHAPTIDVLSLAPLDGETTRHLLRVAFGGTVAEPLLKQLVSRSGGNPLFAREMVRVLVSQHALEWNAIEGWHMARSGVVLPDPVTNLLEQRLVPLSAIAQELAWLLAVLGRPAEEPLLESLWPDESTRFAAQAELLEQWVLVERVNRLRFDHDWLRERLLAMLSPSARMPLHARIAAALRRQPDADVAERMVHHIGAEEWDDASEDALAAAADAWHEGRIDTLKQTLDLADTALNRLDVPPDGVRRWPLLDLRERYHALAERDAGWVRDLELLAAVAVASGRPDWRIVAGIRRGQALHEQGHYHAAEAILREVCETATAIGFVAAEAEARTLLASVLETMGRRDLALLESTAAVRLSVTSQEEALHLRILSADAALQILPNHTVESEARLEALFNRADVRQHPLLAARVARQLSQAKFAMRDYESALSLGREGIRRASGTRDVHEQAFCQTMLACRLLALGLVVEGHALAEATLIQARHLREARQIVALLRARARSLHASGDSDAAWTLIQESADIAEARSMPEDAALSLSLLALIAATLGRQDMVRTAVTRAERLIEDVQRPIVNITPEAALSWLNLGNPDRAQRSVRAAIAGVTDTGPWAYSAAEALWTSASVIESVEDPIAARPIYEQALIRFLDDLMRFTTPEHRRAWVAATPAHAAIAASKEARAHGLILLPQRGAPTGRPLHRDEFVPVVWTLRRDDDPTAPVARRRHQMVRLAAAAKAQNAVMTVQALVDTLRVGQRTVLQDLQALRQSGVVIETRGSIRRGNTHDTSDSSANPQDE